MSYASPFNVSGSHDVIDEAGRECGGVGGRTIAVDGDESEDEPDVDDIESLVGVRGNSV